MLFLPAQLRVRYWYLVTEVHLTAVVRTASRKVRRRLRLSWARPSVARAKRGLSVILGEAQNVSNSYPPRYDIEPSIHDRKVELLDRNLPSTNSAALLRYWDFRVQ